MKNKCQDDHCPVCSRKKNANQQCCLNCKNNPFRIEELRDHFAKNREIRQFKSLYSVKYPAIRNTNTGTFWDDRFGIDAGYKDQDAMTREKIDTIISFIPKKIEKLLDLGFGQGYLEDRLQQKRRYLRIWGIDISPLSVKRAKAKFKGEFVLGNIFKIDKVYRKKFFDAIVALEVIEHISPKNTFSFYKKVHSLLKQNGIFIVSTPMNEGLESMNGNPNSHVRTYTENILRMEMELNGFSIIKIKTHYAFEKFYTLKKILAIIFPNRWRSNNIIIVARKK